jgi:hypothetical protein
VETALAPDQPCVESLRRLMHRIRDELGEALRDDTTLMLIEYRGTG